MNKTTRATVKAACGQASSAVLRRELKDKKGPHHKAVRGLVYAELVRRKHNARLT